MFYRFHAVCAYLRCIFVALCVLLRWPFFDVILVDQVSVVIPLLKLRASSKVSVSVCMKCLLFSNCISLITIYMLYLQIIFYCHFPDLLLAQHTTMLRRLYRKPIDMIEETTTGIVLCILNLSTCYFFSTFLCLAICLGIQQHCNCSSYLLCIYQVWLI